MILRLFDDIEARLAYVRKVDDEFIFHSPEKDSDKKPPGTPAINHFGLWNENTVRLTQSRPLSPPAVFLEFYPATWTEMGRNAVHADIVMRMHIITATLAQTDTPYRDEALSRFKLIRAIKAAFVDFSGKPDADGRSFSRFQYCGSVPDHNHEQICEDLEEWRTHAIDCSVIVDNNLIPIPGKVSLDTSVNTDSPDI